MTRCVNIISAWHIELPKYVKLLLNILSLENFPFSSMVFHSFIALFLLLLSFFFFFFLGLCLWHMEVPRLGIESVQQLLAYAAATETPDLSHTHLQSLPQLATMPDPLIH